MGVLNLHPVLELQALPFFGLTRCIFSSIHGDSTPSAAPVTPLPPLLPHRRLNLAVRPPPRRAAAGHHLQPARGTPHGRLRAAVAAMRRAPPRGRRPVVPAVEEHHGAGRPRRRALRRRPAPPHLRPRRR